MQFLCHHYQSHLWFNNTNLSCSLAEGLTKSVQASHTHVWISCQCVTAQCRGSSCFSLSMHHWWLKYTLHFIKNNMLTLWMTVMIDNTGLFSWFFFCFFCSVCSSFRLFFSRTGQNLIYPTLVNVTILETRFWSSINQKQTKHFE